MAAFYERVQSEVLERLPDSTPRPNTRHITLRGFFEPERLHSLRKLIASWADSKPPIEFTVDALDAFPPPFQVLNARLERTSSLLQAYVSVSELLDKTDFRRIGELPLDDWVFHLSLAYSNSLDERRRDIVTRDTQRTILSGPSELVSSVDLVSYDHDGEHIESFVLGRS